MTENEASDEKLYSLQAIGLAAFLGSPVAAGILIRRNFIALGNEKYGVYAVIIGIVLTALIVVPLAVLPDSVVERIPNAAIPVFSLGIMYAAVSKFQGAELQEHKARGGSFYSLWNAAGIGAICAVLIVAGFLGFYYISPDYFDADRYNRGLAQLTVNETEALQLLSMLETTDSATAIAFIDTVGMVKWNENLKILDTLESIEGLTEEYHRQDRILRSVYQLRIELYRLIRTAVTENTDRYDQNIQSVIRNIDTELARLQTSPR